ncbi:MAG: twin-arginine translocase TatA/TatE family subunit [Dissulfurispiraceae bacterium]
MFGNLFQPMHLVLILIVALVIVGPGKLGEMGGTIGRSIREFKKAMSNNDKEIMGENKKDRSV